MVIRQLHDPSTDEECPEKGKLTRVLCLAQPGKEPRVRQIGISICGGAHGPDPERQSRQSGKHLIRGAFHIFLTEAERCDPKATTGRAGDQFGGRPENETFVAGMFSSEGQGELLIHGPIDGMSD